MEMGKSSVQPQVNMIVRQSIAANNINRPEGTACPNRFSDISPHHCFGLRIHREIHPTVFPGWTRTKSSIRANEGRATSFEGH